MKGSAGALSREAKILTERSPSSLRDEPCVCVDKAFDALRCGTRPVPRCAENDAPVVDARLPNGSGRAA